MNKLNLIIVLCFFVTSSAGWAAPDLSVNVDDDVKINIRERSEAGEKEYSVVKTKLTQIPVKPTATPELQVVPKKNKVNIAEEVSYGELLAPDVLYDVPLSKSQINRIAADSPIVTIKHLPVDGLSIDYEEDDAFIHYTGKKPFLAYVVTETSVYHANFTPANIPATFYLLNKTSLTQKSLRRGSSNFSLKGNSMESRIVEMVKHAYANEPLASGEVTIIPMDNVLKTKELEFFSFKTYEYPDDNVYVKVVLVRTKKDYPDSTVAIREKDFLLPELFAHPIGIAVENHIVTKEAYTRIFLVGANYNMRVQL